MATLKVKSRLHHDGVSHLHLPANTSTNFLLFTVSENYLDKILKVTKAKVKSQIKITP